jgi:hypothetical protein
LPTYTKAQLRNRVLRELGVLAAGETATAEDAQVVEEMIDTQHAMLAQFGVTGPRLQELLALAVQGMADLHTQTQAQDYSSAPITANYF